MGIIDLVHVFQEGQEDLLNLAHLAVGRCRNFGINDVDETVSDVFQYVEELIAHIMLSNGHLSDDELSFLDQFYPFRRVMQPDVTFRDKLRVVKRQSPGFLTKLPSFWFKAM